MGFSIDIDVDDDAAQAALAGMSFRSKDMTPVFIEARAELSKANAENFTTGGLPSGGWSPRKDLYAWPIMRKTNELFGSLVSLTGPGNTIAPMTASFGTAVEYAKFHQSGTTKMAQRKVVFEPRGFSREVASDAAEHITDGGIG
jgi:phage gpG-like protein